MRIPIGRLFGRNPFPALGDLMQAVLVCAAEVPSVIDALIAGDQDAVCAAAKQISRLEVDADAAKTRLRDKLPGSLFLPVDRRDLLQLVSQIDAIADCAEDVGVLLTLRPLTVPEPMAELLRAYLDVVMVTVRTAGEVVSGVQSLLSSGFGGTSAEHTRGLIRELGRLEHEADKLQDQIAKVLFSLEDELKPMAIFMWTKVLHKLGDMANHAENVGDRVRLFLAR